MKKLLMIVFLAFFPLSTSLVLAQETGARTSMIASTPQWEKLKSLVGEWDGYVMEGGQRVTSHISVRMTGGGSALMHLMGAGTPYEMVTMFHMDKTELLATHYCAAHNQPRMRALPAKELEQIAFDFKDGTNIRPGDAFMRQITLTFVDQDHHNETWGHDNNGKVENVTFYMTRAKQPTKQ